MSQYSTYSSDINSVNIAYESMWCMQKNFNRKMFFCERQGENLKRQKNEISTNTLNKQEKFPFSDSFYQFYAGFVVIGSCIDSTKQLIAVLYKQSLHYYSISIYSIEGYLVIRFRYYTINRDKNVIVIFLTLIRNFFQLIQQIHYVYYKGIIHSIRILFQSQSTPVSKLCIQIIHHVRIYITKSQWLSVCLPVARLCLFGMCIRNYPRNVV